MIDEVTWNDSPVENIHVDAMNDRKSGKAWGTDVVQSHATKSERHFLGSCNCGELRHNFIEPIGAIDADVQWMDSYFARGPKTLPVRFKAR